MGVPGVGVQNPIGSGGGGSPDAVLYVPASGDVTGATDVARLNAALAGASTYVRGQPGAIYYIDAPLVIPSNTTLDMTGCTVNLVAGSHCNMVNNLQVAPAVTAADASITSGQATLTSPTLAAIAVANQQIAVVAAGPGNGGAGWLYTTVQSVAGNIITLNATANATVAAAGTAYLWTGRDTNVSCRGGTWNAGNNTGATPGYNQAVMRFRRCDNLNVYEPIIQGSGLAAGGGGFYGINPGDCTLITIKDPTFSGNGDGVHLNGPIQTAKISNLQGTTNDDMCALAGVDQGGGTGGVFSDCDGNIIDIEIDGIFSNGSWRCLSLFAGTGSGSVQRYIRNVSAKTLRGVTGSTPVSLRDYAGNSKIDDVVIEDHFCLPSTPATNGMVDLTATLCGVVTINDICWNYQATAAPAAGIITVEKPVVTLNISRFTIRGALAGTYVGIAVGTSGGSASIQKLNIDGLDITDSPAINVIWTQVAGSTITALNVKNAVIPGATGGFIRNDGPSVINANLSSCTLAAMPIWRAANSGTNACTLNMVNVTCNNSFAINIKHPMACQASACTFNNSSVTFQANGTTAATPCTFAVAVTRFTGAGSLFTTTGTQTVAVTGSPVKSTTATLAAGSAGYADTLLQATSIVKATNIAGAGTVGALSVAVTAGTGATITSTSGADTSKVLVEVVQY